MVTASVHYSPRDPVSLVESCCRALEWILRTQAAEGKPIPRPWIDHPYGEEEITLLEEEVLPVMVAFLQRVDGIDQALEAELQAEIRALEAEESSAQEADAEESPQGGVG